MTLHLDEWPLAEVRRRVGKRGLDEYVNYALRSQLQHDHLNDLLAEMDAKSGPVSDEIVYEALQAWFPEELVTRVREARSSSTQAQ